MLCINAVYIRASLQHLRWAILQCAAEHVKQRAWLQQGRRTKVNQSDMKLCVYDDVLIFNVPVQYAFPMKVSHCWHQLSKHKHLLGLLNGMEFFFFFQDSILSNPGPSRATTCVIWIGPLHLLTYTHTPAWRCSWQVVHPAWDACLWTQTSQGHFHVSPSPSGRTSHSQTPPAPLQTN